jgi:hypothetical protein
VGCVSFSFFCSVYGIGDRERAYIVDEYVNSAQLFHGGCYGGVDCFVVAHVRCAIDDLTARILAGSLELLLQSTEFVLTTG